MDGFVKMVKELAEIGLMAISLVKETIVAVLPKELGKVFKYAWDGAMGLGNWVGFALAAAYFFGLEYGYGPVLCDSFGYGYYIIDALHIIVGFATAGGDKNHEDEKKEETAAA